YELAAPLEGGCDHVVDQAMLIFDTSFLKLCLVFAVINLLEDVLEAPVIGLENRVFRGEIERPGATQAVIEAGMGEVADRRVQVVHAHGDSRPGEVEDVEVELLAILADPAHRQLARARHLEVGRAILVAESVAANHDRIGPAGNEPRHVRNHYRLAKDAAAED